MPDSSRISSSVNWTCLSNISKHPWSSKFGQEKAVGVTVTDTSVIQRRIWATLEPTPSFVAAIDGLSILVNIQISTPGAPFVRGNPLFKVEGGL